MENHIVVQGIRDALAIDDDQLTELLATGGGTSTPEALARYREPCCSDAQLLEFLDGLVAWRRGPRTSPAPAEPPAVSNNLVLKKLRVALALEERDVLRAFAARGRELSKRELTPWFRKPGSKHFRACDDDTLAMFLSGLSALGLGRS